MEIIILLIIGILMGLWANIQIMSLIKAMKKIDQDAKDARMAVIQSRLDYLRRSENIMED
jgi:hypothetical protein